MRLYFHVDNGSAVLDGDGLELPDMQAAQEEAVLSTSELIKGHLHASFWGGKPWKLWVTDQPNGHGKTVLTLDFTGQVPS
jgi:hypothetical protein